MSLKKQKLIKTMQRDPQELIDAMEHISFEMNRYLFTTRPCSLPQPYPQIVAESCLLHSRNVGEFFFEGETQKDDIRLEHYNDLLTSKDELEKLLAKSKLKWKEKGGYKDRINKKLSHLTFARLKSEPMNMREKDDFNIEKLIQLFQNGLPEEFKQKWEQGKAIALR